MKIEDFRTDLEKLNDGDYQFVVKDYFSREERHYCAYLFSWLIQDPQNVKTFLESFTPSLFDKSDLFNSQNVKLFYEFTWLRDIIYEVGRLDNPRKNKLKDSLNNYVFERRIELAKKDEKKKQNIGDIQKKKPDLAIYLKSSKKLILIEAKFEEKFDNIQIKETKKYGEALTKLLGKEFLQESVVALLGRNYYLDKLRGIDKTDSETVKKEKREKFPDPCLSWEKLAKEIKVDVIKEEIEMGIKNQKRIHPKT